MTACTTTVFSQSLKRGQTPKTPASHYSFSDGGGRILGRSVVGLALGDSFPRSGIAVVKRASGEEALETERPWMSDVRVQAQTER